MQYQRLFHGSPNWQAEYTSRQSESWARFISRRRSLAMRAVLHFCSPLSSAYAAQWERKREDEIVERAKNFDIVFLVKTPGTKLYQRLHDLNGPRLIMDINDAVWLPEFNWHDLSELLALVDGVVCENEYVANYARKYNSRTFVIPDSPQVDVFDQFRNQVRRKSDCVTLGWIGGAQNIAPLLELDDVLEHLFHRYPELQLRVVGADSSRLRGFERIRYSCRPSFNQQEMVREVLGFDIGLFPLLHNEDGRARGTLKAKVYMSGGATAVCENFGENPKLITDGVNGVLAGSPEEWHDKLDWLIRHPDERTKIAKMGLETVRKNFTAEHLFARLSAVFEEVLA